MRPLPALLVAFVAMTLARSARASPSARLVYSRSQDAEACPDEPALRKAVAARVGYDPFFPWAKSTVVIQIDHHHRAFAAHVELIDELGVARGTRELSSTQDDCVEIFDAAALAISIALDASTPPEPAQSTPSPAPAPEPAPHAPPVVAPEPQVALPTAAATEIAPAAPPPLGFFAGVDVLASSGTAPSLAAGSAVFAGARVRFVSLAVELRIDAPASTQLPGGTVTSWLYAGTLAPCAHYSVLSLCAVGTFGSLQAAGQARDSLSSSAPFVAVGGRLGGEWRVTERLGLRAHADLLRNVAPVALSIDDHAWTAPAADVSAAVGLVVHFP